MEIGNKKEYNIIMKTAYMLLHCAVLFELAKVLVFIRRCFYEKDTSRRLRLQQFFERSEL